MNAMPHTAKRPRFHAPLHVPPSGEEYEILRGQLEVLDAEVLKLRRKNAWLKKENAFLVTDNARLQHELGKVNKHRARNATIWYDAD